MDLTQEGKRDIQNRVNAGAQYLDTAYKHWRTDLRHTIDGDSPLQMHECEACVLGKLLGDYFDALPILFPTLSGHEQKQRAEDLGFTLPTSYDGVTEVVRCNAWRYLEQCWLEKIMETA